MGAEAEVEAYVQLITEMGNHVRLEGENSDFTFGVFTRLGILSSEVWLGDKMLSLKDKSRLGRGEDQGAFFADLYSCLLIAV